MILAMIESWELLVVVAVIALLFGTKRIPDLARSLGKAKSEFHQGISEASAERAAEIDSEKGDASADTAKTGD